MKRPDLQARMLLAVATTMAEGALDRLASIEDELVRLLDAREAALDEVRRAQTLQIEALALAARLEDGEYAGEVAA